MVRFVNCKVTTGKHCEQRHIISHFLILCIASSHAPSGARVDEGPSSVASATAPAAFWRTTTTTPATSTTTPREHFVVGVDAQRRCLVFHQPPTRAERTLQSLITIHGYFASTLAPAQRIMAMVPVVHFLRSSLDISFRRIMAATNDTQEQQQNHHEADNETVADAALHWLDTAARNNQMTPWTWQQIEQIILLDEQQDNHNHSEWAGNHPETAASSHEMATAPLPPPPPPIMARRDSGGSTQSSFSLPDQRASSPSFVPRGGRSHSLPDYSRTTTTTFSSLLRKRSRRDHLEAELEQVQKRVRRNHKYDVRRGKGQGVKNVNAKLYTPLVHARCLEYSSINTGSKNKNDELKQAIAMEILIELAQHGGRVLDEDNVTVLDNHRAVKKIMNALKDKAREMKKKGGEDTSSSNGPASEAFVPDLTSSQSSSAQPSAAFGGHHNNTAHSTIPHQEAIEPEDPSAPAEGEALECFSSYWLRRRG